MNKWTMLIPPVLFAFLFLSCNPTAPPPSDHVDIKIWYGHEQHFGKIGNPQWQINILGNIDSKNENIKAYFLLNSHQEKKYLTLGSDLHRLARKGDFNIEIPRNELLKGKNNLELCVEMESKLISKEIISVYYHDQHPWPLPYQVRWEEVKKIQDVVEVVDGDWILTGSGIRTNYKYYDRIIAFGDSTWENYEVETTVVFHGFTPPEAGPPTYDVSHVAIASRWPGHDQDELQPNRKWFPLGATSEFRITKDYRNCRWRIFDGENFYAEQGQKSYRTLQPEVKYRMKHPRVNTHK
jgi:hypothetical protein